MWQNMLSASRKQFSWGSKSAVCFFTLTLLATACSNQLEVFSDQADDDALFYDAQGYIRSGNYSAAINSCLDMSASYQEAEEVKELCAMAYAGRCGYTLMGVLDAVASLPAGTKLSDYYITAKTSTAQQVDDCDTAEGILRSIGTAAQRTENQNILMLTLSMHKIAMVANEYADLDEDNIEDAGFDACDTVTDFPDAAADLAGSAFWEMDKSLDALVAGGNTTYTVLDTVVDTVCGVLSGAAVDICGAADPTVLNAAQRNGARSIVKEGAFLGVDQCTLDADVTTCRCP